MSDSVRDKYWVQVYWIKSCSILGKEIPVFVKSILLVQWGPWPNGFFPPSALLLFCAQQCFPGAGCFLWRCSLLLGFLKLKNVVQVLFLCSLLFYSTSSSVLHWKSQIDANPGISALAARCQRADLFWSFSAGFTRIFVGLLTQSSFRVHKNLLLHWLFGRFSGYHVFSGETYFDSKNRFSYGWIPLLGQTTHSHQCLLCFCDSVMLRAASLTDLCFSLDQSNVVTPVKELFSLFFR